MNGVYANLQLFSVGSNSLGLIEFSTVSDKSREWRTEGQFRKYMAQIQVGWTLTQVLHHSGVPESSTSKSVHYEYTTKFKSENGGEVFSCTIAFRDSVVTGVEDSRGQWDVIQ